METNQHSPLEKAKEDRIECLLSVLLLLLVSAIAIYFEAKVFGVISLIALFIYLAGILNAHNRVKKYKNEEALDDNSEENLATK